MAKNKFIVFGILGALITLFGKYQPLPQVYYLIGCVGLLTTAIYYKLIFYIALELILIAEHSAILLGSGPYTQFALPILLCFQLLFIFFIISKQKEILLIFGILGIALLALGFAYSNDYLFMCGSILIAIYSYYNGYQGNYPSYIWAVLNTLLALLSLYKLFF